jgi:signal peptidase I
MECENLDRKMTKEERKQKKREQSVLREYFELIAETAIFVFFVMTFVAQASQVPTGSMENTMLIGDFLLVNKMAYADPVLPFEDKILPSKSVEHNDIVVFKSLEEPGKDLVKRVVGIPGDEIEIKDKQVYINGDPVAESFKLHKDDRIFQEHEYYRYDDLIRDNFGPLEVPPGHYFVMGDNRDESYDSRYWGFLPFDYIKGRPWVIYFSYDAEENTHLHTSLRDRLGRLAQYFPKARWGRILHTIN